MSTNLIRRHAREIWDAAVAAVRPDELVRRAVSAPGELSAAIDSARRILVVGGGKAGTPMAAGLEQGLVQRLDALSGVLNVPAGTERSLKHLRTIPVRPAGTNQPTPAAVARTSEMLELVAAATPEDLVICLLSGGGSALLPAPAEGITLADKQTVTRLLHECGATIGEMNSVRKHLSRFKGGGLVRTSKAGQLVGLIISDVIGDPLDVIASGPTAPDPTTFGDALAVIHRYDLLHKTPQSVRERLERGAAGDLPETLKQLPPNVRNTVIGNNALALAAAQERAEGLGYRVVNLGSNVEGETRDVARQVVVQATSTRAKDKSSDRPLCMLIGGETTVTLTPGHGKGGRNTEFVLAAILEFERRPRSDFVILSGGTDGEDGPTDAAGAVGDWATIENAKSQDLDMAGFLRRNDSYAFFAATGDLLKTGLTRTNVMDVRMILMDGQGAAH